MTEQHAVSQASDTSLVLVRESAYGKQHLVLLRFDASKQGSLIASLDK
jgi:hypothetical protein